MQEKRIDYRSVILVFLSIAGLLVLLLLHQNRSYDQQGLIKIGHPAPDFRFPGINGKMAGLSDYRGKVVLINIWATWCSSCVDEMPSMEKLYQKLKGENFEILAVSIDSLGEKVVAPFMKKHKLTFPALIDSAGTIRTSYGTTGVPESFIINKNGILVQKIIGPLDWGQPEALRFFRDLILNS
ncbi:MAG: TlpA disulfide reductase family protein [Desulfobacterales bacterium]